MAVLAATRKRLEEPWFRFTPGFCAVLMGLGSAQALPAILGVLVPIAAPLKLFGLRQSRMNPNLCTQCERNFGKMMKMKQVVVPATILFADVRGYTTISEVLDMPHVARLLSLFYEQCATQVWARDGIINKLIGDAVLAIFNFPITQADHVRQAVLSALEIQRRCLEALKASAGEAGPEDKAFGVGIGLHTGRVSIGEVGEFCKEYTAIGGVVNIASRLQGAAAPGEVLVTEDAYREVHTLCPQATSRMIHLKGLAGPIRIYSLISAT